MTATARLDASSGGEPAARIDRLRRQLCALEAATGRKLLLAFEVGDATDASLAAQEKRERAEAKARGEQAFRNEPFVRDLLDSNGHCDRHSPP